MTAADGAPTGIVDSHVHLLPDRLETAIRRFFVDLLGDVDWAYPADTDAACAQLAGEGIVETWTLPYAHRPGMADGLNDAVAAIAAAGIGGPVRVIAGATTHPAEDDPVAPVRRAVEDLGARVLKLHCSVADHAPDDPRLDGVWSYVSAVRLPVVVHAGHAPTGHTAGDELDPIDRVATRWPEARIIIAHCGHHAPDRALSLLARHPSLHVDLTPVVSEHVAVDGAALAPVADRVLFGSDAPNTLITAAASLERLAGYALAADARDLILGGNARRLQAEIRT